MTNPLTKTTGRRQEGVVVGLILITIGLFLLVAQLLQPAWGVAIPLGLGVIFLLWGSLTHKAGLLIPGGILSGIGVGILLITGPWSTLAEETQGGIFLLCFAGGWVLITVTSALFTARPAWWALIPGGMLALVGGAVLIGGPALRALELLGQGWPLILILVGLYLVIARGQR